MGRHKSRKAVNLYLKDKTIVVFASVLNTLIVRKYIERELPHDQQVWKMSRILKRAQEIPVTQLFEGEKIREKYPDSVYRHDSLTNLVFAMVPIGRCKLGVRVCWSMKPVVQKKQ